MRTFDRSKTKDVETRCFIPGLPDEIALVCLAKVPLSYRHVIRWVCTSWRSVFNENILRDGRRSETVFLFQAYIPYGRHVWHCLHPSTKDWVKLPATPDDDKVRGGSTSAVMDEKLFLVGGWSGNPEDYEPLASPVVCYFDMKAWQWNRTASLNIARADCMVGVIKNQLFACGGYTDEGLTSTAEVYDPTSQAWTLIASMKSPVEVEHGTVIDEKLYVTYATRLERGPWDKGIVYDPRVDEWSDMPNEKYLTTIFTESHVFFNGKYYVKTDNEVEGSGPYTISIFSYNAEKSTFDLFHNQTNEEDFSTLGHDLLVFEGKLCIVYRYLRSNRLQYVIKDLENRVVASSKSLFLRAEEEAERNSWSYEKHPKSLEYQIMVL